MDTTRDARLAARDTLLFNKQGGSLLQENLADDLLRGAAAIAEFLYGDPKLRRKVFHLAEKCRIPIFRLGSQLCARKSVLLDFMAQGEARGWGREHAGKCPVCRRPTKPSEPEE